MVYRFCFKLSDDSEDTYDPKDTLSRCEAATFKTYLEWRVKNFRIKKESTIKAYWRRILCKFIDVTGHSMDNGVELDIRDVQFEHPFSKNRLTDFSGYQPT
jgi:hypothetical protein